MHPLRGLQNPRRAMVLGLMCLLGLLDVNSRAQVAQTSATVGAISGVVRDQKTGTAVSGALVEAINKGVVRAVLTDARGRFVLVDLGPADYLLNVTKAGFGNGRYSPALMGSAGGVVVVKEGGWEKDVEIRLKPLSSLAGRVTDSVRQAVVGVPIRAMRKVEMEGRDVWVPSRTTTTNDLGEYRIAELDPGQYTVVVLSAQHSGDGQAQTGGSNPAGVFWLFVRSGLAVATTGYPSLRTDSEGRSWVTPATYAPGVSSVQHAASITLEPGSEVHGIDVVVEPQPAYVVTGRLPAGASSLIGQIVRLMPESLDDLGAGHEVASTRVRADGTFVMAGVPTGAYTLRIPGDFTELVSISSSTRPPDAVIGVPLTPAHPGARDVATGALVAISPTLTVRQYSPSLKGQAVLVRQAVVVADRDVNVDVEATAAGHITGEVLYEGVQGGVASGTIHFTPADSSASLAAYYSWLPAVTTTERSTFFDLAAMRPGSYVPRVQAMAPLAIKSVEVSGIVSKSELVTVNSGERASVRLILVPAGRVAGNIRSESGNLAKGSSAIIFPTDRELWTRFGFTPSRIRVSNGRSDGHYELSAVRPGEYFLAAASAEDAERWMDVRVLERLAGSATRITVASGNARQVDLVISGRQ